MKELSNFFKNMCDEMKESSVYDPELQDGLKWIDGEAKKRGIDTYEMIFIVLSKYDADKKAEEWSAQKWYDKNLKPLKEKAKQNKCVCGAEKNNLWNFCPKCGVTLP